MNKTIELDSNFEGTINIVKGKATLATLTISGSDQKNSLEKENCYRVCVAYDDEGRCLYWNTVCDSLVGHKWKLYFARTNPSFHRTLCVKTLNSGGFKRWMCQSRLPGKVGARRGPEGKQPGETDRGMREYIFSIKKRLPPLIALLACHPELFCKLEIRWNCKRHKS